MVEEIHHSTPDPAVRDYRHDFSDHGLQQRLQLSEVLRVDRHDSELFHACAFRRLLPESLHAKEAELTIIDALSL